MANFSVNHYQTEGSLDTVAEFIETTLEAIDTAKTIRGIVLAQKSNGNYGVIIVVDA